MAHRLAPEVESELDNIWYYIATESGNVEIADRLIDSIASSSWQVAEESMLGRFEGGSFSCAVFLPQNTAPKGRKSLAQCFSTG